jgi:hypothetical protein
MNVRSWVVIIGVSVLALACGTSTNPKSMTATATPVPTPSWAPPVPGAQPAASQRAPDLLLATPTGEFRLSEQKGKVTVLYFSFPG